MNSINLIGRLTKAPEVKEHDKTKICEMRMAVSGQPDEKPVYVGIETFGARAEACAKYLSKGSQIGLTGALKFHEWGPEGEKRSKLTVRAFDVRFLDSKPEPKKRRGRPRKEESVEAESA